MKKNLHAHQAVRQLIDYAVIAIAFMLTRQYIAIKGDVFFTNFNFILLGISFLTWTITGTSVHLYDDYDKSGSFSYEFVAILKTVLLQACIFTFVFFYFFKYYTYPRTFTLLYSSYLFAGMTTAKFFVKKSLQKIYTVKNKSKNIVIIGAGETGLSFYHTIVANDHFGYNCVGFVDDRLDEQLSGPYLGKVSELRNILASNEIDDVVVALPEISREQTEHIITTSERAAKRVKIIADCYKYCTPAVSSNIFGKLPLVPVRFSPMDDPGLQRVKRWFDVIFTLSLLITFSWLFVIIAILIKFSSKGPVIFKQERWGGLNNKIICYKFRTMRQDNGQFKFITRNDDRITWIGRILRKTGLDELPQFFNVLKGDMSFVGPRPHAIPEHMRSIDTVQRYMMRHLVKPGITGWAQINGCRGSDNGEPHTTWMQRRVDCDLWYIENYSFWLDCQIIFQTLMNMIKGDKNAY
jgi:putative colanic acid biosysnthesis UDP-glucose lipid carrier transferase